MDAQGHPFVMNPELSWSNPGYEQNDSFPVTCVSWHDAQNYISWLNKKPTPTTVCQPKLSGSMRPEVDNPPPTSGALKPVTTKPTTKA
ncbi:hypothetical protein DKW60_07475 [Leucothrix pacifica]|uniref:Sulfatase-modifying factor enzyme-like domain-containing protein n=1 Tax=Leucothrix pacifica TaxID=1247513 RepID=A0A317CL17_9GAMM|nr:hypothetical protein DKW60_07475 [Leucothrix pacifica]